MATNDGPVLTAWQPGQSLTLWRLSAARETPFTGTARPMPDTLTYRFINGWVDTGDLPCREALRQSLPGRRILAGDVRELDRVHVGGDEPDVDYSHFAFTPMLIDRWADCIIVSSVAQTLQLQGETCGALHVWCNGMQVLRHEPYTRNSASAVDFSMTLEAGESRLLVYFDDLHERDTRCFFRLSLRAGESLQAGVSVPVDPAALADATRLLSQLRTERLFHTSGCVTLIADNPPDKTMELFWIEQPAQGVAATTAELRSDTGHGPKVSSLYFSKERRRADLTRVADCPPGCLMLVFQARIGDVVLERRFGTTIAGAGLELEARETLEQRKSTARRAMLAAGQRDPVRLLLWMYANEQSIASTTLYQDKSQDSIAGTPLDQDDSQDPMHGDALLRHCLVPIVERQDCSDFWILPLLWASRRETQTHGIGGSAAARTLQEALLDYRYWLDEPGNDVMWFWSENHVLCFHAAQYLAGCQFPDHVFRTSGRTGQDMQTLAGQRLARWFEAVESHGFIEWNSAAYYPIDLVALLCLHELSEDAQWVDRSRCLLDRIFTMTALHTSGTVPAGSQGRAYEKELLAGPLTELGSVAAVAFGGCWYSGFDRAAGLLALSSYTPPAACAALAAPTPGTTLSAAYTQGVAANARIRLWKSAAVQLSTVVDHHAGEWGHQQHVVDVQMAGHPFARTWINHPGELKVWGAGRPSYWAGNGVLPRVAQWQNAALLIYDLDLPVGSAERHPIPFTHLFCPVECMDEIRSVQQRWHFARQSTGFLGIWSSQPLQPVTQGLYAGSEWRLAEPLAAWLVLVGDAALHGDFDRFIAGCLATTPIFDADESRLSSRASDISPALSLALKGPLLIDETPAPACNESIEPAITRDDGKGRQRA